MDSPTTAPLVVLCVAGFGLLLVAVAAVLVLRPGRRPAPGATAGRDDLPAFHARPPGSAGALVRPTASGPPVSLAPVGMLDSLAPNPPAPSAPPAAPRDAGIRPTPVLLPLAAVALAVIAAAAAVGMTSARADHAGPVPAPQVCCGSSTGALPALPPIPDSPAPGQPGAGDLAYVSLPLGRGDTGGRLSFGAVVLQEQAVGATVTRADAGWTTHASRALLHLRLPTWNCLAPDAPDDPAAEGCVPSVTEYGDLPSPALSMSTDGRGLVLQGRVPTYTRPDGSGPVYTGRVYDVTLTVHPGRRLGPDRYVADGVLTLGTGTARTGGDPAVDVLTRGR